MLIAFSIITISISLCLAVAASSSGMLYYVQKTSKSAQNIYYKIQLNQCYNVSSMKNPYIASVSYSLVQNIKIQECPSSADSVSSSLNSVFKRSLTNNPIKSARLLSLLSPASTDCLIEYIFSSETCELLLGENATIYTNPISAISETVTSSPLNITLYFNGTLGSSSISSTSSPFFAPVNRSTASSLPPNYTPYNRSSIASSFSISMCGVQAGGESKSLSCLPLGVCRKVDPKSNSNGLYKYNIVQKLSNLNTYAYIFQSSLFSSEDCKSPINGVTISTLSVGSCIGLTEIELYSNSADCDKYQPSFAPSNQGIVVTSFSSIYFILFFLVGFCFLGALLIYLIRSCYNKNQAIAKIGSGKKLNKGYQSLPLLNSQGGSSANVNS